MFGNPRGHLISTIRGGNNSIFSVLKVGFWLKGSYVRICGSSEIGPRMTVLTLRAKLKLYVGQFRPGGALSGTAEINVLKRLGVHVEILLPFGNSRWTCLDFVYGLHFGWVSSKNIPLSSAVQKDAAQVGWRPRMHLCASRSVAGAYLLLPQSMLGYISMTLNIKRVQKKKIKDASLEVTERNRSARRDWRLELRRSQSVLSWHAVNHAHARIFTSPS